MGVGVSYTGYDGKTRKFNADSAPSEGSMLDRMFGSQRNLVERTQKELDAAMSKLPQGQKDADVKVAFGGSIVKSRDGLCLEGEQHNPNISDIKMFASVNGRKGFFAIGEIDANTDGAAVGKRGNTDTKADENERKNGDRGGWRIPISRMAFEYYTNAEGTAVSGMKIYQFDREIIVSEFGRVLGLTKETGGVIGAIEFESGGGDAE